MVSWNQQLHPFSSSQKMKVVCKFHHWSPCINIYMSVDMLSCLLPQIYVFAIYQIPNFKRNLGLKDLKSDYYFWLHCLDQLLSWNWWILTHAVSNIHCWSDLNRLAISFFRSLESDRLRTLGSGEVSSWACRQTCKCLYRETSDGICKPPPVLKRYE